MTRTIIFTIVCALMLYAHTSRSDDTGAIWLARSCIGEAGWDAWRTGECAAILHVYRKRAGLGPHTTVEIAHRYSAAIKPRRDKRNRWVRFLRADGKRPEHWPRGSDWEKYRANWVYTMILVELFLAGTASDPLPPAMHYGCAADGVPVGHTAIKTRFRNKFYRPKWKSTPR